MITVFIILTRDEVLSYLTSLDKGTQPFVVCDG